MSNHVSFCSTRRTTQNSAYPSADEWTQARSSLSNAMDRYLDTGLQLSTLCMDTLTVSDDMPAILRTFDEELNNIESYVSELRHVHAIMGATRNSSRQLVPINRLPREVLSHIFTTLVLSEYWSPDAPEYQNLLRYPNLLSEVCISWNRLIENTPSLWSHIQLVISEDTKPDFYARASQLLKLSQNVPLFLRICEHEHIDLQSTHKFFAWLSHMFDRVYYLGFHVTSPNLSLLHSVLRCWFEHGRASSVEELDLYTDGGAIDFIEPGLGDEFDLLFNISSKRFKKSFEPLTFLRLDAVFPRWGIPTYGNLIHLSLSTGHISEAHLAALLSNNSQLRTLNFGLHITEPTPHNKPQILIQLSDLQILTLNGMKTDQVWLILRLLAPGPCPIKMSLERLAGEDDLMRQLADDKHIEDFFQRSNVTNLLFVESSLTHGITPWFPDVFYKLPHLVRLYLDGLSFLSEYGSTSKTEKFKEIQELCLINCELNLDALKDVLRAHRAQVLRLCECTFYDTGMLLEREWDMEGLEKELAGIVPNVRCYDESEMTLLDPYHDSWGYSWL